MILRIMQPVAYPEYLKWYGYDAEVRCSTRGSVAHTRAWRTKRRFAKRSRVMIGNLLVGEWFGRGVGE
jgi:hypothetical protein